MARGYQKCRGYMLMLKEETGNENAVGAARENWSREGRRKKGEARLVRSRYLFISQSPDTAW